MNKKKYILDAKKIILLVRHEKIKKQSKDVLASLEQFTFSRIASPLSVVDLFVLVFQMV